MAPPTKVPASRAAVFALAAAYFLLFSLSVFQLSTNDIWIHLKTGEQVLATGRVPDKDVYSYSAAGREYVAHEWLAAVIFHLVHRAAGVNGLIFFKHAVLLLTSAALFLVGRIRKDHPALWIACFTLALFIGSARFLERPQIFSYLFLSIYLLAYFAYRDGGRPHALYALPPLHALWANMHGGHYSGVFLLLALAVAESLTFVRARLGPPSAADRRRHPLPLREIVKIGALPFACLAAALLNPYGIRALTFPFELTSLDVFMRGEYGVLEWQTLFHPLYNQTAMFLLYCVWTALLLASFVLAGDDRRRPSKAASALAVLRVAAILLAGIFLYEMGRSYANPENPSRIEAQASFWYAASAVFLIGMAPRANLADLALASVFFALSVRHNRAVTDAVLATLPVLSGNLSRIAERFRWKPSRWVLIAAGIAAAGLGVLTLTHGYRFSFRSPAVRQAGLGIARHVPLGAVSYMKKNGVSGRVLTSYDAGGLLIHELWPGVLVGMDSRNDVYGEDLYLRYRRAMEGGPALREYLETWSVEAVVVTSSVPPPMEFFSYLDRSGEWALVYVDARAAVYLRRLERFRDLIARDERRGNTKAPGS